MRHGEVPFTVDTDIDLGQAAAPWMQTRGDVRIRRGTVPRALAKVEMEGLTWQCAGGRLLITFPWGVRFLVEGGESIYYAADDGVDLPSLRLSLLSNAWIALALQRGLLPLHANAVASDTTVHACTAPSGEGKSTLAAALAARGHPFFADDVLLLDPAAFSEEARCYGYKDLKLWRDGAKLTGARLGQRVREVAGYDKYFVEPLLRSPYLAGRLETLYELRRRVARRGSKPAATIERVSGGRAAKTLYRAIHRRRMALAVVGWERLSGWLMELIPHVSVFRFHRIVDEDRFDEGVTILSEALPREAAG